MNIYQLLYIAADNWKMTAVLAVVAAGLGAFCSGWWFIPAGVLATVLVIAGLGVLLSGGAQ